MEQKKIITYDVYNKEYEANAEDLNISVHIYGIAEQDGKILISPQYDGYDFPGGTAEKGETHLETLVREVKEETGYTVEPVELLNIYTSFFHHNKEKKDYQSYLIYYQVKVVGGEISTEGFDENEKEYAKKAQWVKIEDLMKMRNANSIGVADELLNKIINKKEVSDI